LVYHNNFFRNKENALDNGFNQWDNGTEGNYWDDYTGEDKNGDGIGDIPYHIIAETLPEKITYNEDRYPLMQFPSHVTDNKRGTPSFEIVTLIIAFGTVIWINRRRAI